MESKLKDLNFAEEPTYWEALTNIGGIASVLEYCDGLEMTIMENLPVNIGVMEEDGSIRSYDELKESSYTITFDTQHLDILSQALKLGLEHLWRGE